MYLFKEYPLQQAQPPTSALRASVVILLLLLLQQQAYAALADQCWQADPEARPSFARLVCALHDLLQRHETLQLEVDKANRRIGTFD